MSHTRLRSLVRTLPAVALLGAHSLAQDPAQDHLTLQGGLRRGTVNVSKAGSVYSLRFRGADEMIEYQIDVNQYEVRHGMLRVWERFSDSYPIHTGGVCFRNANNATYVPTNLAPHSILTSDHSTADAVVLDYTDSVPNSGVHHRRHTLRLEGKVLAITIEDLDQSTAYLSNYSGFMAGPTAGTEDPRLVLMQGALATPVVLFQNGSQHYFLGSALDLFQSNASDWVMPDHNSVVPGASSIDFTMDTRVRYYPTTAGQLSAPLKDTWRVVVTRFVKDALLAPTQAPSPYRELVDHRAVAIFAEKTTSWAAYTQHLAQFRDWGMDDLAVYCFNYWSASLPDAPNPANQGPDWYPARDPGAFTTLSHAAEAQGVPFGVYTAFSAMPLSAPSWVYNPAHIARNALGQYKTSIQLGTPLMAISASGIHALREATDLEQDYGVNLAYLDVQSYASPSRGADGDHVDQRAGSGWASTLGAAILAQKTWMRSMQDTVAGPLLGEGSIATQGSSMEWLWAGYCDSVQRVINSGSGLHANAMPAGDPRSPTKWPVIPEFELRVLAPLQANHGNGFYDRFFSRSDAGMVDSGGNPIYPLSEAALDRYRIYELSYGHTAFFMTSGPFNPPGNMLQLADLVKEYYLVRALQSRYLGSPVKSIAYEYQGALQSFEAVLFQTETTDSFRDPRLRLRFESGLAMYLNHGPSAWNVTVGGVPYTIPEDGFVAHEPASGFLAFSAIAPGTNGNRVDYCFAPGEYEFFDGRGAVNAYGGINTGGVRRLKVDNFVRGLTVQESSSGVLQTYFGTPPAVQSVELVAATNVAAGARIPVRALAHFVNGAFRDVTTLVDWSSSNVSAARVNEGGALIAVAPGQATISATSFGGVAPAPLVVTVQ